MSKIVTFNKISILRKLMKKSGIDAYLILNSDPHLSEYLPDFYKSVLFVSGFSGSAGSILVTQDKAFLWTDGRYYLQAERELEGSGIELQKQDSKNTFISWLKSWSSDNLTKSNIYKYTDKNSVSKSYTLGVDFATLPVSLKKELERLLRVVHCDLIDNLWEKFTHKTFTQDSEKKDSSAKDFRGNFNKTSHSFYSRPPLPNAKIYEHEDRYCSFNRVQKLFMVREKMRILKAQAHLISSLDDIAWITNLRGSDVEFNPVFLSHLLILDSERESSETKNSKNHSNFQNQNKNQAILFIHRDKITPKILEKLEIDGFCVRDYDEIIRELQNLKDTTLLIDPSKVTALMLEIMNKNVTIIEDINPSTFLKSIKTHKEIGFIKKAMIEDGVALCRFFAWLESALSTDSMRDINELDIDEKITAFRAKSPFYVSNSFATIAGFNQNSALPHYKATQEDFAFLKKEGVVKNGLLLIDSGAQYKIGTTDITRVVHIRNTTKKYNNDMSNIKNCVKQDNDAFSEIFNKDIYKEQMRDYTLVLKAHIAISSTIFPNNIAMPMLDSITRTPLWREGLDFMHGSGHGVGYFLNVHEGPQVLSCFAPPLEKTRAKIGMLTSIEPGVYTQGKWGVRLENLVITAPVKLKSRTSSTRLEEPRFLCFKPVTLCPFEPCLIDVKMLSLSEKKWLNDYHSTVFKTLSPKLDSKEDRDALKWLTSRTKKL